MTFRNRTIFISGASRGIGLAIARRRRATAPTSSSPPRPPSRTRSCRAPSSAPPRRSTPPAARRCRSSCDIRDEEQVTAAVDQGVAAFGGIDICVNNASAISLTGTLATDDEALRPDEPGQRARHLPLLAGCLAAPAEGDQPAHPQPLAAAQPRPEVVRPPRRLHDGQVRHEHVHARHGGRVQARKASPSTRSGRAPRSPPPPSASRSAATRWPPMPHAGDHGRRRPRDPVAARRANARGNFFIDEEVLRAEGVSDFSRYAAGRATSSRCRATSSFRTRSSIARRRRSSEGTDVRWTFRHFGGGACPRRSSLAERATRDGGRGAALGLHGFGDCCRDGGGTERCRRIRQLPEAFACGDAVELHLDRLDERESGLSDRTARKRSSAMQPRLQRTMRLGRLAKRCIGLSEESRSSNCP